MREWELLVNHSMYSKLGVSRHDVIFREDMAYHVLSQLRQGVFQQLAWLIGRSGTGYIRRCRKGSNHKSGQELLDTLLVQDEAGSVLWLGPADTSPFQRHDHKGGNNPTLPSNPPGSRADPNNPPWDPATGPGDFTRVRTEGNIPNRYVPVYNLPHLLGKELVSKLRGKLNDYLRDEEFLSIKAKQSPLNAQLLLLKLQFYLSDFPATPEP